MPEKWARVVVDFLRDEEGPTAVEYAVMLALIVVVCIAAVTALGGNANKVFANASLNIAAAGSRPERRPPGPARGGPPQNKYPGRAAIGPARFV